MGEPYIPTTPVEAHGRPPISVQTLVFEARLEWEIAREAEEAGSHDCRPVRTG